MRSALWICIAAVASFPTAASPSLAAAPEPACDRECLGGFVDQVLQAMMDHDPSHAPLAAGVRYTENGQVLDPGQGLWSRATAIAIAGDGLSSLGRSSSAYRLYFADPGSGQAAYFGAFTENGAPGMMMLRLRVSAGKVSEIETVAVGKAPQEGPVPALDPRGFDRPEPALLAGGERWGPNIMTAAANRYFDAMQTGVVSGVPVGADCIRRDNGVRLAASCAAQIEGGARAESGRRRRRVMVVDQDRGLVMAAAMVDHGVEPSPPKKRPRLKKGETPPLTPAQSTDLMGAVFKMSGGKITRVEAIDRPVASDQGLGWP